jgi:hypothetical protein
MAESQDTNSQMNGEPSTIAGVEQIAPDTNFEESQRPGETSLEFGLATPAVEREHRAGLSPGAIFFGALVSLGFLAFVLLAKVTVHPFDKIDRRMRVLDVWTRLHNHLPEVAHPKLLEVIFDVSIILIVVGSLACIWIALLAVEDRETTNEALTVPAAEPPAIQSEH